MNQNAPVPSSQYYFLHLPKTAGTSLIEMAKQQFAFDEIFPFTHPNQNFVQSPVTMQKYKFFAGHFDYIFVDYFIQRPNIFTVLRDPVERVLSHFSYWMERYEDLSQDLETASQLSLMLPQNMPLTIEAFIEDDSVGIWGEVNNSQTARIAHSIGYRDQFTISDDDMLRLAFEHLESFECVGTTEDFTAFLELITYRFSWYPIRNDKRRNVTQKRLQADTLSASTLKALRDKNQLDIALHERATQLSKQAIEQKNRSYSFSRFVSSQRQSARISDSGEVYFDFSQPIYGENWYDREGLLHLKYAWMGPKKQSTLVVMVKAREDLHFEIGVIHWASTPKEIGLTLNANSIPLDHTIAFRTFGTLKMSILTGRIPAEAIIEIDGVPVVELGFEVERTVSPQELDPTSTDNRQLGIAVSHVRLRPVRSTPAPLLPTASFARLDALVARLQKGKAVARLDWVHQPPALADGWYDPERGEDAQPFAWTGPATRSTVALALPPGKSFLIELDLHAAMDDSQIDGLRMSIDGQPLRLVRGTRHGLAGWLCAEWTIAVSDPGRIVTLALNVPHVASPRERFPDSLDIRLLGVAVRDIRISAQPTLDEA